MDTGEMRGLETAWGSVLDFLLIIHVTLDKFINISGLL